MKKIDAKNFSGFEVRYIEGDTIIEGILYDSDDELYVLHNDYEHRGGRPRYNPYEDKYHYSWSLGSAQNFSYYLNRNLFIKSPSCLFARTGQTISDGTTTYFVAQAFDYVLALRTNDGIILKEREELEANGFTVIQERE